MTGLFYTLGLLMSGFILAGCTAQQSGVTEGPVSGVEITGTPSASGQTTPTGSEAVEGNISEGEAKAIALEHSGMSESDVTFLKCKLEKDDGVWEYEVEFYHGDKEYDYDIHAVTGEILSFDSEVETSRPSTGGTESSDKLTEGEAKAIALEHSGLSESDVTFLKCKLDSDDGVWEYEVEFYHGDKEYDYEIHAVTGEILSFDSEVETSRPSTGGTDSSDKLTEAEAKAIALEHSGLSESDVTFLKCKLDSDDGVWEYEVEFYHGDKEYDYEIHAVTGEILSYDFEVETSRPSNGGTDATNITDATAIAIALDHVSVKESEVSQLKCELDKDDGVWEYEIEFKVGKVEYEFKILASDGKILEFEKD